jgi:hypothetical protein
MPKYTKPNIVLYYTAPKKSAASFSNAVFNIILESGNLLTNDLYILITNEPLKLRFTNKLILGIKKPTDLPKKVTKEGIYIYAKKAFKAA